MNKMNIPAPFRAALPTPPLPPPVLAPPPPPVPTTTKHLDHLSSDESEMESSEVDKFLLVHMYRTQQTIFLFDKMVAFMDLQDEAHIHSHKRVKREAIVGPAVDKAVAHEDVGLKPVSLTPNEVPVIKKKNPILQVLSFWRDVFYFVQRQNAL